jgi:hypothetical protein
MNANTVIRRELSHTQSISATPFGEERLTITRTGIYAPESHAEATVWDAMVSCLVDLQERGIIE